jgi:tetratricopeptide (TPR) repeat protein
VAHASESHPAAPAYRPFIALLLLWLAGCATATPERVLERGWLEVRSGHFSIYTTHGESTARELLEDLELFRATAALVTHVRDQTPRVPTEIYVFGSAADFNRFVDTGSVGIFLPGLRSNLVAISAGHPGIGRIQVDPRAILYHEYTHFLVHNQRRSLQPPWFDEGFAQLLSSIHTRGGEVRIGSVPPYLMDAFSSHGSLLYSYVIRARALHDWPSTELAKFYAQSWLLVHFLSLGRLWRESAFAQRPDGRLVGDGDFPQRLERYVDLVEQRIDEEQAFRDAFGLDFAELQAQLEAYREIPSYGILRSQLDVRFETETRAVSPDEIATRLGWLAIATRKIGLAEWMFARASLANPANSRAIAGIADSYRLRDQWDAAEPVYRRSLELEPDRWENHLEYAGYLLDRVTREQFSSARLAEAREHSQRAIELAPEIPEAHAMLGMTYLDGDQPPDPGIAALERALELLPSHPGIQLALAQLHIRAGHRERAIELLRPAVHRIHTTGFNTEAAKLLDELEGKPN